MANETKKETTKTTNASAKNTNGNDALKKEQAKSKKLAKDLKKSEENVEKLTSELNEFKSQFQAFLEQQNSKEDVNDTEEKEVTQNKRRKKERIDGNEIIEIQSMIGNTLNLVSKNPIYPTVVFDGQFQIEDLSVNHIKELYRASKSFFEKGMVYVDSPELVKELRLEKFYKNFLTPDELDEFFNLSKEEALEKYKTLPQGQKNAIDGRIFRYYVEEDENLDMNIVSAIDKEYVKMEEKAKKLVVKSLAEKAKKYRKALDSRLDK